MVCPVEFTVTIIQNNNFEKNLENFKRCDQVDAQRNSHKGRPNKSWIYCVEQRWGGLGTSGEWHGTATSQWRVFVGEAKSDLEIYYPAVMTLRWRIFDPPAIVNIL